MIPSLSVVIELDNRKVNKERWMKKKLVDDSHYNHFFGLEILRRGGFVV